MIEPIHLEDLLSGDDPVEAKEPEADDSPDDGTNLNGSLATQLIRKEARHQCTDKGTTGHRSRNSSLDVRSWAGANRTITSALIEVAVVLLGPNYGRHARYVKLKSMVSSAIA